MRKIGGSRRPAPESVPPFHRRWELPTVLRHRRRSLEIPPGVNLRGGQPHAERLVLLLTLPRPASTVAADYAEPTPGGGELLNDFRFASGEALPGLALHYRALEPPRRGADGEVDDAVLILHGTTGSGATSFGPSSPADFRQGPPLDASRYYVILPDGIGHGGRASPATACRPSSRSTATTT